MRPGRLIVLLLCALSLVVAGCSEEESGIGAGQDKQEAEKAKPADDQKSAGATQGANTSQAAARRKKPAITVPKTPAPTKLGIKDLEKGTGATVKAGDQIVVNYSGALLKNGKVFDNSFDRGQPFPFQLGAGMVIPGWDQGLVGAKVGARRQLTIPAELAYGPQGSPPAIPPNAPLVFVIDVLAKQ